MIEFGLLFRNGEPKKGDRNPQENRVELKMLKLVGFCVKILYKGNPRSCLLILFEITEQHGTNK